MRLLTLLFLMLAIPMSAFAYVAGPDPIANENGSCKQAIVAVAGCFQLNGLYELHLWGELGDARRVAFSATEGKQSFGNVNVRVKEYRGQYVMLVTFESADVSFAQLHRLYDNSTVNLFETVTNCSEARDPSIWRNYFTNYLEQIRDYD